MKNLLLFSTILLTSAGAFAQLTVKPNGTADSYVYVKDQVLFVTSDINLTRNGVANNQEASIYLRDNGQLIQGGTSSINSGDGQLSVQQNTPVTTAWAYYYWCSPIGNTRTTAGVTTVPGNRNFGVGHLYEPLPLSVTAARQSMTTTGPNGAILPQMTISTRWLYTHINPGTEAEADYQRIDGGNNAPAGFGFIMKGLRTTVPGYDQTYDFRGRPNSGTFTIPVAAPVIIGSNPPIYQMTLSGNPYPSALDLNKLYYDPENIATLGTFWYYDEDRTVPSHNYSQKPYGYGVYTVGLEDTDGDPYDGDNLGTYVRAPFAIYNSGGGSTTTGGQGGNDQNKRFAPIGQGIMFVGKATGTVKIKNSHRLFFKENIAGSIFQRPTGDDSVTEENLSGGPTSSIPTTTDDRTPIMRLWAIFDDAVTRDMVLAFYDEATDGYDRGLDGMSAQDLKNDAYFPIGNDNDRAPYVINGIKYDVNKQIPIAFKLNKQSNIKLRIIEQIKKPYEHVLLFDSQENTYKELSTASTLAPTLTLPAGKYENRFFIVFRSPFIKKDIPTTELARTELVRENVTFFQNNPQHQMEVSNPEGYTLKSASVYDMSGKLVISESNLGDNNKYTFYTGNLSDGVYLVKLMTTDNIAIDYKAIVHNQ